MEYKKMGQWEFRQRGNYVDVCCSVCGHRLKTVGYNVTVEDMEETYKEGHFKIPACCDNCYTSMGSEK